MNKMFKSQRCKGLSHRSVARRVQGFTLLELLVVIVIIGMLASYVGPKYFAQIGKSEVTVAKAQLEGLSKAMDTLRIDLGRYPTAEEGLRPLMVKPDNANGWNGVLYAVRVLDLKCKSLQAESCCCCCCCCCLLCQCRCCHCRRVCRRRSRCLVNLPSS